MSALPELPDLEKIRTHLSRAQGRRSALQDSLRRVDEEISELRDEESVLEHVSALFRSLIDSEIKDAVTALEDLQAEALKAVFDDQELSVETRVAVERGKVAVDLVTTKTLSDGTVQKGISREAFGGSVTTVESVLLRVLILAKRDMRRFLLLDEALPAFDPRYATNMGKFLVALCDRLGLDILIITHNQTFVDASHRSYRVRQSRKDTARFVLENEVQR